jgi:hypothetical protein
MVKSLSASAFQNPFRPGAGHPPPYLAGREKEKQEFETLLDQRPVMTNLVMTGLRGVGKTVLLETFKPIAVRSGWLWAGTDLSESASVTEDAIAVRILADLAPLVSTVVVDRTESRRIGFGTDSEINPVHLDFDSLKFVYDRTPGLVSDKVKATLGLVWASLEHTQARGIVLAYDEAQNLSDQAANQQYPLSLLLDVFQSIQKRELPILLVLTGLPTLFPKLVDARTFAERMFHVTTLGKLDEAECRDAIVKPVHDQQCPVKFTGVAVREITKHSGGYPYFIQYLCRAMFDSYLQQRSRGAINPAVTVEQTVRLLDSDFFAGRWNRVTDRQRDPLSVVSRLPTCDDEFTVQEVVAKSRELLAKPFSPSHVNQMFAALGENGLVYKNRHGRYSFAVPLLGGFIRRQENTFGQA